MVQQDQELVRVDAGVLGTGPEEVLRVPHQVLIQGVAAGHQDARAMGAGAARPAPGAARSRRRVPG